MTTAEYNFLVAEDLSVIVRYTDVLSLQAGLVPQPLLPASPKAGLYSGNRPEFQTNSAT